MSYRDVFEMHARLVVAKFPGVRLVETDGRVLTLDSDGDYRCVLECGVPGDEKVRGVWLDELAEPCDPEQFILDLTEACVKLTELTKETDE